MDGIGSTLMTRTLLLNRPGGVAISRNRGVGRHAWSLFTYKTNARWKRDKKLRTRGKNARYKRRAGECGQLMAKRRVGFTCANLVSGNAPQHRVSPSRPMPIQEDSMKITKIVVSSESLKTLKLRSKVILLEALYFLIYLQICYYLCYLFATNGLWFEKIEQ